MPGLNHSGPKGQGAMTGKRMGKCTNFGAGNIAATGKDKVENSAVTGQGKGKGQRRGLGHNQID